MARSKRALHIACDIGGTFTDFVLLTESGATRFKVPTTPHDVAEAVLLGIQELQTTEGTTLVHEIEVDLGDAAEQFGGVETFKAGRGAAAASGMQQSLENIKSAAEK